MSAVIANVEDPGLNFTFSIFWPKFSAHQYFQASSQIEADSWVSVMKKAQSICRASVGNGSMPSLQRAPLLNGLDEQGNGVIHRLAYFGRDQDLQALVEQGPDINLQNIRGDTALHLATSEGREKAVIVLLKAKAQVDAINRKGLTPLHIACLRQNDKLVALLLESGANPHIRHFNGKLAADMTDRKKIREMLNKAAQSAKKIEIFGRPLSEAISLCRQIDPQATTPAIIEDTVNYLLSRGVEVEGIFKTSGDAREVKLLQEMYQLGRHVDLTRFQNPHSIASLLKLYLRELEEPLIPYDFYEEMIKSSKREGYRERIVDLVHKFPEGHRIVLFHVMSLFAKVAKNLLCTKMNAQSLAAVIGPNIMRPRDASVIKVMNDTEAVRRITISLIDYGFARESVAGIRSSVRVPIVIDSTVSMPQVIPSVDEEHVPANFLYVKAIYEFNGDPDAQEISFQVGDIITILQEEGDGWWLGAFGGIVGYFPCNYVAYLDAHELALANEQATADAFDAVLVGRDGSTFPTSLSPRREGERHTTPLGDAKVTMQLKEARISQLELQVAELTQRLGQVTFELEQERQISHAALRELRQLKEMIGDDA
eukprot:TRINITY_DN4924_c0_g1_i7.p1 TRINITY_DN4924_c0_g1~~TRINITY_DN4924_c0_g1_i7.p1  ORF type:complete len:597 (+),score=131.86 TRINITY_DN4924_c0_g1_i7:280-2070(+)